MKTSELGDIIEKLGRNIAYFESKAIRAYRDCDFEESRRYHEKALAMEKRVAKFLDDETLFTPRGNESSLSSLSRNRLC